MDEQLAQAISNGIVQGLKGLNLGFKAPGTTPTTNLIHGPGGLFGQAGLDNQVISARVTPRGIAGYLKAVGSVFTNPLYPYVTGVEESAGTEPSTPCETCLSGVTESCWQTATFGYICRESQTLTPQRVIERINSGEIDLTLVNDILGGGDPQSIFQAIRNYDRNTIMNIATAWAMLEVAILLQNKLTPMMWQGNPANNVGTGYMEFPGLDILISQNKVDAYTGVNCEALYSDVKSFNYQAVNSVDANGNFNIVRMLEYLEAYLYHNADRQNLLPATWAMVMRPEQWYELTNVWPIAYLTTRNIVLPTNNSLSIDASRVKDMMDQMREGLFIFLNGRRHDVILDDGIYEYNGTNDSENLDAGEYAANIYMVPLTYLGARPGTYLEHKDYRGVAKEVALAKMQDEIWSDDGRFLWTKERVKYCYTMSGVVEPRVVLKVPQLAGRLNLVKYTPAQHFRSYDPSSDYFYKGGKEERPSPSLYSDWNLPE